MVEHRETELGEVRGIIMERGILVRISVKWAGEVKRIGSPYDPCAL